MHPERGQNGDAFWAFDAVAAWVPQRKQATVGFDGAETIEDRARVLHADMKQTRKPPLVVRQLISRLAASASDMLIQALEKIIHNELLRADTHSHSPRRKQAVGWLAALGERVLLFHHRGEVWKAHFSKLLNLSLGLARRPRHPISGLDPGKKPDVLGNRRPLELERVIIHEFVHRTLMDESVGTDSAAETVGHLPLLFAR